MNDFDGETEICLFAQGAGPGAQDRLQPTHQCCKQPRSSPSPRGAVSAVSEKRCCVIAAHRAGRPPRFRARPVGRRCRGGSEARGFAGAFNCGLRFRALELGVPGGAVVAPAPRRQSRRIAEPRRRPSRVLPPDVGRTVPPRNTPAACRSSHYTPPDYERLRHADSTRTPVRKSCPTLEGLTRAMARNEGTLRHRAPEDRAGRRRYVDDRGLAAGRARSGPALHGAQPEGQPFVNGRNLFVYDEPQTTPSTCTPPARAARARNVGCRSGRHLLSIAGDITLCCRHRARSIVGPVRTASVPSSRPRQAIEAPAEKEYGSVLPAFTTSCSPQTTCPSYWLPPIPAEISPFTSVYGSSRSTVERQAQAGRVQLPWRLPRHEERRRSRRP